MERSDSKSSLRVRKFSWTKMHSVREDHVTLKRSGSLNNIIMGLNKEFVKCDKKKRPSTVRLKKKSQHHNNNRHVISTSTADIASLALLFANVQKVVAPGVSVKIEVSYRRFKYFPRCGCQTRNSFSFPKHQIATPSVNRCTGYDSQTRNMTIILPYSLYWAH